MVSQSHHHVLYNKICPSQPSHNFIRVSRPTRSIIRHSCRPILLVRALFRLFRGKRLFSKCPNNPRPTHRSLIGSIMVERSMGYTSCFDVSRLVQLLCRGLGYLAWGSRRGHHNAKWPEEEIQDQWYAARHSLTLS